MTTAELHEKAKALPLAPGVYFIKDNTGKIIYIGKAKLLVNRVSQYFNISVRHEPKVAKMVRCAFDFHVIVATSEYEALVLECSQIKLHRPKYNILLKDDKGFSFVRVEAGDFPKITLALQKLADNALYIGPYYSSFAVREMVQTANFAFKLPTCSRNFPADFRKARPCLNSHIGRCMAACSGKISKERYKEAVESAVGLIKKGNKEIVRTLTERMEQASQRLDFEAAALLRDQIQAIQKLAKGQKIVSESFAEQDVLAVETECSTSCIAILAFRDGRLTDKKEFVFTDVTDKDTLLGDFLLSYYAAAFIPKRILLPLYFTDKAITEQLFRETKGTKTELLVPSIGDGIKLLNMAKLNAIERLTQEGGRTDKYHRLTDEFGRILGLKSAPDIIEAYDISNFGENSSVGSMVVFENCRPKRSQYRRFDIKTVVGTDDYKAMAEVLTRRVARFSAGSAEFSQKPDIILLDGGAGHLSTVADILKETDFCDVPVFGMVKDHKHRTRALVGVGGELAIAMHKGVFAFVTSIQDEAHRFAIEYQRKKHKKTTYKSRLTEIKGIGEATAKTLFEHFKTITAIKNAELQELQDVKGVSKKAAELIYNEFHKS